MAEIVRSSAGSDAAAVQPLAASLVPAEDRSRFIDLVVGELRQLHEGNIARYRLRLAEYREWKARQS